MSALPLKELAAVFQPYTNGTARGWAKLETVHPEQALVAQRIAEDLEARLAVLLDRLDTGRWNSVSAVQLNGSATALDLGASRFLGYHPDRFNR